MVPPEYSGYFMTMASVAATLFGLIFLAVSIVPESTTAESAPLERQLKATAAYVALANPLITALFALVPHQEVGPAVVAVGAAGLLNSLMMILALLRDTRGHRFQIRNSLFIVAGLVLYGFELDSGIRLLRLPGDGAAFYTLSTVLIFMLIFGVARAWELVGGRQFHFRDWMSAARHDSPHADLRDGVPGRKVKRK